MTRSGIVSTVQCVVCLRKLSADLKTTQPNNPRKVFKVCSNYLKPDVFTKYPKWDLFSDQERETPFCSMCATSAEKLSAMNDRLEEVQREIISFVKYFAKEVLRHRHLRNDDESSDDNGNEENLSQSKASFPKDFLNTDISRKRTRNSTRTTSAATDFKRKTVVEDDCLELDNVVVKEEIEEQISVPEDYYDDYLQTQEDMEEDDVIKPKGSSKIRNDKLEGVKSGSSSKKKSDASTPCKKALDRRCDWKEISYSEEQLEKEWRKHAASKRKESLSVYYYCRAGGKYCPARLLKKVFITVRYFENGKPHRHNSNTYTHGICSDLKLAAIAVLEQNPNATTSTIIEALKVHNDIDVQSPESKRKLNNLLMYERRKRLIKAGSYVKRTNSNNSIKSGQDSAISGKRNRGRPLGSVRRRAAVPPSSTADIPPEVMHVSDPTAASNASTQKIPSSNDSNFVT